MPKAIKFASRKMDLPSTPSPTDLQVIYAVRRLGLSTNATIKQYLIKMQNTAPDNNISMSLKELRGWNLIEKDAHGYALTPTGREFLSLIRRYLVNVRL